MAYAEISLDEGKTVSYIAETSEHLLNLIDRLFKSDKNLEHISIKYIEDIDGNNNISRNTINNVNAAINGTQANIIQDDNIDLDRIKNQELLNLIQSLPLKKRAKIITMIYDELEKDL